MFTFLRIPPLTDGVVTLQLDECVPMRPGEWAPSYNFISFVGGRRAGHIHLRIGENDKVYYGGNIGYGVRDEFRGHGYAARACLLVPPVARAHGMTRLAITCTTDNYPSMKTIERCGGVLEGVIEVPEDSELRYRGIKRVNRYLWDISGFEAGDFQPALKPRIKGVFSPPFK